MTMKEDPLDLFQDKEICPTCSAIHPKNVSRCPECGIFHDAEIFAERTQVHVPRKTTTKVKPVDPGMYSLNPHSEIPDDGLEEIEIEDNTISWSGGSTDFSFDEEEPLDSSKVNSLEKQTSVSQPEEE